MIDFLYQLAHLAALITCGVVGGLIAVLLVFTVVRIIERMS